MSFELLRRQLNRIEEVAAQGTFDSVVESVEAAAAARAVTDEGRLIRGRAGKKMPTETKSQKRAVQEMQHGGSIALNENVARKVAEARMQSDVKKNVQDNQRRFLHSRMSPENLKHIEAARAKASKLMHKKTDTSSSSGPSSANKKKAKRG